jgi:hypothetical protein
MKDNVNMSFMQAPSFMMMFTVDTTKPSSSAITDRICPPSYLHIIIIFISKSMAVHLYHSVLFLSCVHLPPAMVQNMEIFLTSKNSITLHHITSQEIKVIRRTTPCKNS